MPCYQQNQAPANLVNSGVGSFATEAECLEACKEGACCDGTTCSVKPQCQCDAEAGEVFKGVGTVCSPNPCSRCGCETTDYTPESLSVSFRVIFESAVTPPGGCDEAAQGVADYATQVLEGFTLTALRANSPSVYSVGSGAFRQVGAEYVELGSDITIGIQCTETITYSLGRDNVPFRVRSLKYPPNVSTLDPDGLRLLIDAFPIPRTGSFTATGFPCVSALSPITIQLPAAHTTAYVEDGNCNALPGFSNDFVAIYLSRIEIVITPIYANPLP